MSTEERTGKPELAMVEAQIGWSKDKFRQLVQKFQLRREWEPEFPEKGKTAAECTEGNICLYEAFFVNGKLRIPVTNFLVQVLQRYGIHNTQLSLFGVMRIMHFEATLRAVRLEPNFE